MSENPERPLYHRLMVASEKGRGRLVNLAEARELICEAMGALSRQQEEITRLRAALTRLRDCDWVITPLDRMDAVRDIARAALDGRDDQAGR